MKRSSGQMQVPGNAPLALALFNSVLRIAVVSLGGWVGYQLTRQNGRILLELEEIRARLDTADASTVTPSASQGLPLGTPAPTFDLPTLDGGRVGLQDLLGRRTLAVFFDPNCGFCRQMAQDLAELPQAGLPGGPAPIMITTGDEDQNRKLVVESGITCPVLLQRDREVAAAYAVSGTPMAYVIDAQGRIASELGIGAQSVLMLAERQDGAVQQNGDPRHRGDQAVKRTYRPVTTSQILRSGLPAGSPAPALQLPSLDGDEVALEDYRGQRVLLVFSDPTCGPCNQLAPQLEQIHRSVKDFQILMVSRGQVGANREKAREHGLTFPVVLQRRWEASRAYGMFATPVAYLIDERGIIAADAASGPDAILALADRAKSEQAEAARA